MSRNVTIHFLLALFFFSSTMLYAQVTLELKSPSSIADEIQVAPARFGTVITDQAINGEIVYVDGPDMLGCNPISIDLTGKIAMIDRGTCNYSLKAYYAQQAGATAMLLAYEEGRELMFVLTPGDSADAVQIPVAAIVEEDYAIIKQALETESVQASIYNKDVFEGSNVVFEETFPFGLNGWTSEAPVPPDSHWVWTQDGGSDQVVFFVNSPTSMLDGAAIFDAAWFSRDVGPNPPYPDYTGELISPPIDVSDHNTLYLTFYQSNWPLNQRNFPLPQTAIQYSIDDGITWSQLIEVETENVLTSVEESYHHTETVRMLLEDLNFTENLRLKFIFDGDYYIWALDDIRLIVPPDNELALESTFYPLIHYATPEAHISTDTMGFRVDLINGGLNDLFGNTATVSIVRDDDIVYHEQIIQFDLPAFGRDTLIFNSWAPTLPQGNYTLNYVLDIPNTTDEFPDNNSASFPFVITEDVFSQELASQEQIVRSYSNSADPYYWGSVFTVSSAAAPPCLLMGTELAANANDGALDGENFTLYLLKWNDNNDGYPDYLTELVMDGSSPLEHPNFELRALSLVDPSGLGQNELFELNVSDGSWLDENAVPLTEIALEPGTYAIVGEFSGNAVGLAAYNSENLAGVPTILYNIDNDGMWSPGFVDNFFPVIRTTVQCAVANSNQELSKDQARVYPSITADRINIELDLETRQQVELVIMDMQGRRVIHRDLGEVRTGQFTQSLKELNNGLYLVNLATADGQLQSKITVMH